VIILTQAMKSSTIKELVLYRTVVMLIGMTTLCLAINMDTDF
jgi:hypothetical protein